MRLVNIGGMLIDPENPRFGGHVYVRMAKAALEHGDTQKAFELLRQRLPVDQAQQVFHSLQESVQETAHNTVSAFARHAIDPKFGGDFDTSHVHDVGHHIATEHGDTIGEVVHHIGSFLFDLFS